MTPGTVSPARIAAVRVLMQLEKSPGEDAPGLLACHAAGANLGAADARLATALVMACLRNRLWMDFQVRRFLSKSPGRMSPGARVLLRLAATQHFLFDRLPPHAIANDGVEIARSVLRLAPREVGFVNAVTRRVLGMAEPAMPDAGTEEGTAARYSVPAWIVRLLEKRYGAEDSLRVLEAVNREPRATLRVNLLRTTRGEFARTLRARGVTAAECALAPAGIGLADSTALAGLLGGTEFADGLFYVQDEASQLVPLVAAPQAGESVLDLCAAPGGKTTQVAEMTGGLARICATDVSDARLDLLRENVQRMRTPGVEVVPYADVCRWAAERSRGFDLVLVDAPCSGLGTMRRHPEMRYGLSPDDIGRLANQQAGILDMAARLLAEGGRIVYSTCTVTAEENAQVIARFLETHPGLQVAPPHAAPDHLCSLRCDDGFYRTWPHHPGMDGFESVAVCRRARLNTPR